MKFGGGPLVIATSEAGVETVIQVLQDDLTDQLRHSIDEDNAGKVRHVHAKRVFEFQQRHPAVVETLNVRLAGTILWLWDLYGGIGIGVMVTVTTIIVSAVGILVAIVKILSSP